MSRVGRPPEYCDWTEQQKKIWDHVNGHTEAWRTGEDQPSRDRYSENTDADTPPHRDKRPRDQTEPSRQYAFSPINSAIFAAADYAPQWIIPHILVKNQPGIAGGPRKALKTTIFADLVISVGSGLLFLGKFRTCGKRRTAIISGESGPFTLQETMKRICAEKGIEPQNVDCLWDFRLPRLSDFVELMELRRGLEENKIELLVVDPIYLALLAGQKNGQETNAANLFDMGPLFMAIAEACLSVGTTPLLIHHARKNRANPYEPLELEDLAFAGIQEFARQWLLIARREPYEPGTGEHRLWLTSGGSIGHGNSWALNINEGVIDEEFKGRIWKVEVTSSGEVRQTEAEEKKTAQKARDQDKANGDDERFLAALDSLSEDSKAVTVKSIRDISGLSSVKASASQTRLRAAGIIENSPAFVPAGMNGTGSRSVPGVRRKREPGEPGENRDFDNCPGSPEKQEENRDGLPLMGGSPGSILLPLIPGSESDGYAENSCPGSLKKKRKRKVATI